MSGVKSAIGFGAFVMVGITLTVVGVIVVEVAEATPDTLSYLVILVGLGATGYVSLRWYRRTPTVNGLEKDR
jgi:hypothetical protein